jgi:hypothetical protein
MSFWHFLLAMGSYNYSKTILEYDTRYLVFCPLNFKAFFNLENLTNHDERKCYLFIPSKKEHNEEQDEKKNGDEENDSKENIEALSVFFLVHDNGSSLMFFHSNRLKSPTTGIFHIYRNSLFQLKARRMNACGA